MTQDKTLVCPSLTCYVSFSANIRYSRGRRKGHDRRVSQHMKYIIDMNAPLPTGAPIDKLEEE
jgi:hypothetical protein